MRRLVFIGLLLCLLISAAGAVDQTIPAGYTIPAGITTSSTTSGVVSTTTQTLSQSVIASQTSDTGQLQVTGTKLDPEVLMYGDTGTLTVDVVNTASHSITVKRGALTGNGAITVNDKNYAAVGDIGPGAKMSFTFTIKAGAPDGIYYPEFSLQFPEGTSLRYLVPVKIDNTGLVLAIQSQPDAYSAGQKDSITLSVGNPRQNSVNGVTVNAAGPSITMLPATSFIGTLGSNSASTTTLNITPAAPSNLTVQVLFTNGLNRHTQTLVIPVEFSESKTRADMVISNIVIKQSNSTIDLTGDITNAGLTPAKAVVVTPGKDVTGIDPYKQYVVGSLQPDDFSSFELTFNAKGATSVPVIVTYLDADGNQFSKTIPLSLGDTADTSTTADTSFPILWVVILLLAILVVGYVINKSWKRG
ncbi:COG1361 family protein [Methanosphaerula palustris]|uniref:S-layer domain-like protein n=1 Tax=Methanosphaerula palustris (strain ATCC BAA-1556 / DSM 19958 / E1-9c) TaxID=521011 RepID=B8GHI3_METPE|nr:hypothetical protein [Methanosphaerula palustris]ACL16588.1 conserved hypothetical protein [Methanosphaerula palustris E1-9c]